MLLRPLPYTVCIAAHNSHTKHTGESDSITTRQAIPSLITGTGACLLACSLFFTLGVLLIPLAGLQSDEALFGAPLYPNINNYLWTRPWRIHIPVMEMSYLGSLKSFLYLPILETFGANIWTIRLPVVLAGALTIFLFYKLVHSSVGRNAAVFGAFLLATDPLFLMTNTFDWGPVALEHLFLVTGCWALFQFGTRSDPGGSFWHSRARFLALGFLCFGLALWNKAIFLWSLAGLGSATLVVLWPWVRREWSGRHLGVAVAAFALGASPWIYYNLRHPLATFQENATLEPEAVPGKWVQVEAGLQGNSLFGYIAAEEWLEPAKQPQGWIGQAAGRVRDAVGEHRNSGFYYVLGALLVLIPLWWRSRAAWFSLVFCAVTWTWMAMTHDAGASAHHVVLLWPFPVFFAAVVLGRMPWFVVLLAGVGMVGSNLLVVNQYLTQLHRNGAYQTFTDAIFPLSEALEEGPTIYITDWGMFDSLNLLHQGRLNLRMASGPLMTESPSPDEVADIQRMLQDPNGMFVGHVRGMEVYPNVGKHLDAFVGFHLERKVIRTISDSNGRPVFEISRVGIEE